MSVLIAAQKISKSFDKAILVDKVSFSLSKGEITVLVGQNGAGKTTLARIILGLEKYDSGKLIINHPISMSYVPQKLDFQWNMPFTSEDLINILAPKGLDKKIFDFNQFINYNLVRKKDVSKLSGGQLQKIILIGALMNLPDFIILDEPTQFLDLNSQQLFYRILYKMKIEVGLTVLIISHDLYTVMKRSDQVICLNHHVCCSGKPSDINNNYKFQNLLSEIGIYNHNHNHNH